MTRTRALAMLLAAAATLAGAPRSHAQGPAADATACAARIGRVELRASAQYAPLAGVATDLPVEVEIPDADGCGLALAFRSAQATRLLGPDGSLRYQLRDDEGRVIPADTTSRLALPAGRAIAPARVVVSLPPGQVVRAGRYSDRLLVQLLHADRVIGEREVELAVQVRSQASISLAGTAASGFSKTHGGGLDFGELTAGKEREALLFVLSNAAYALRLSSANHGSLRHVSDASTIAYTARLDGAALDLRNSATVEGRNGGRFIDLTPYRLNVRIGDVSGRAAGRYRDVITVDVLLLD